MNQAQTGRSAASRRSSASRRPLRIFLFDPFRRPGFPTQAAISVPGEALEKGPRGARLEVVDYDATLERYAEPVDLESREALLDGGLAPDESDPRFHQQMVYAVASKTLEHVDRALGRTFRFHPERRLRILPHAFQQANAYYDRSLLALLFGYFTADADEPGRNLPGQTVFTCLSHDIVAHETMHAVIDRLRPHLFEPTNADTSALHEGLADVAAILQHFTHPEALVEALRVQRGRVDASGVLVHLAQQFGEGLGLGGPLRTALGTADRRQLAAATEAHDRGAIFLAAILEAFFAVHAERARPLLRIATGGTGSLPAGDLAPDLADYLARDVAATAQRLLTICIRAFDYLPPVDIDFGDYLRALVSADRELFPNDAGGYCGALVDAFLARGVHPEGAISSSVSALSWSLYEGSRPLDARALGELLQLETRNALDGPHSRALRTSKAAAREDSDGEIGEARGRFAAIAHRWGVEQARELGLAAQGSAGRIALRSFHPAVRIDQDGQPRIELVAQFVQTKRDSKTLARFGGLPLRAGCTVVFEADGRVRYVIAKPSSDALDPRFRRLGRRRVERIETYVGALDEADASLAFLPFDHPRQKERMLRRARLHRLHERRYGARPGGVR